jgi:NTE family protein
MWMHQLQKNLLVFAPEKSPDAPAMPSMLDVLATCMDIVNVRIGRSRMAGEPPEVVVAPRLARLRLLDFHRAKEAIEEGHRAVERVAHNLAVLDDSASVDADVVAELLVSGYVQCHPYPGE